MRLILLYVFNFILFFTKRIFAENLCFLYEIYCCKEGTLTWFLSISREQILYREHPSPSFNFPVIDKNSLDESMRRDYRAGPECLSGSVNGRHWHKSPQLHMMICMSYLCACMQDQHEETVLFVLDLWILNTCMFGEPNWNGWESSCWWSVWWS